MESCALTVEQHSGSDRAGQWVVLKGDCCILGARPAWPGAPRPGWEAGWDMFPDSPGPWRRQGGKGSLWVMVVELQQWAQCCGLQEGHNVGS